MSYLWLKYIHVLSSTILFGMGFGTACTLLYGHWRGNVWEMAVLNRYVVKVDWIFTGISGFVQLITGLGMVYLAGYSLKTFWIFWALMGYFLALICWLPVVYLQIKLKNITEEAVREQKPLSSRYYRNYYCWFLLGWPAFLSLMVVFYLMVMKPS